MSDAPADDTAPIDVAIVGGGPAGLSAALILGRCCRKVIVFDSGHPRNYASHEIHGFLTRDGAGPADLRTIGREQLDRYGTVRIRDVAVDDASPDGAHFVVTIGEERIRARKLLLATGVRDELPDIAGFEPTYGVSSFHCPYCDGFERRGGAFAVLGEGRKGYGLALELLGWSHDIVLCTNGPHGLDPDEKACLERNDIAVDERPIERIDHEDGAVRRIVFAEGGALARDTMFFASPANQACGIASALGCEFNERGSVLTSSYEKTNVPGLYVAGDASHHVELAIVAAAEGAMAAFAINAELLEEDRR
jgi:thioredoxin reductase